MSLGLAILLSLGVCAIAAGLEGLCAGKNVKAHFARLRWPSYSLPLWAWYIIGGLYYAICFVVLLRIFKSPDTSTVKTLGLILILLMMAANAFWNLVFFRLRDLFGSLIVGFSYPPIAIALFVCLLAFDRLAAWFLLPYLVYQFYAGWWGYRVWKINTR